MTESREADINSEYCLVLNCMDCVAFVCFFSILFQSTDDSTEQKFGPIKSTFQFTGNDYEYK